MSAAGQRARISARQEVGELILYANKELNVGAGGDLQNRNFKTVLVF